MQRFDVVERRVRQTTAEADVSAQLLEQSDDVDGQTAATVSVFYEQQWSCLAYQRWTMTPRERTQKGILLDSNIF